MFEKLILAYLRHFPIDYGKGMLEQRIVLPKDDKDFEFTGSNGTKYLISFQDHVMRKTYTMGMYERNTIRQLIHLANKDLNFIDVGANIGAFTLNLAPHVQHCYSFEPNPRSLRYLDKNIEINGLTNVTVVRKGLSDKEESLELFIQSLGSSSFHKHQEIGDSEQVHLTTLDLYCEQQNLEHVDLVKMDIEGHEMSALLGAKDTIARQQKMAIVLELDENTTLTGHSRQDYLNFMEGHGFKSFLPRGFPFPLKPIDTVPAGYKDNVVFLKGY